VQSSAVCGDKNDICTSFHVICPFRADKNIICGLLKADHKNLIADLNSKLAKLKI